jgi:hypothetical protein
MTDHLPDDIERPSSPNNALVWYLIISLPGTVILIGLVGVGGWGAFAFEAFWTILCPVIWVFPIVTGRQIYNVASDKFVPITGHSYVWAAVLIGLYLWSGLAAYFILHIEG